MSLPRSSSSFDPRLQIFVATLRAFAASPALRLVCVVSRRSSRAVLAPVRPSSRDRSGFVDRPGPSSSFLLSALFPVAARPLFSTRICRGPWLLIAHTDPFSALPSRAGLAGRAAGFLHHLDVAGRAVFSGLDCGALSHRYVQVVLALLLAVLLLSLAFLPVFRA